MSIPKIIHYCWFGGAPLDDMALRCIESWKRFFPEYEIIQWNENNFDVSACDFMRKAYDDKKWAFVSDVARLMVVYEHGGIYFDTDVEVVAPFDAILANCSDGFLGIESTQQVNTGLGFGAVKHSPLLKELLSLYEKIDYEAYRDSLLQVACTVLTTNLLGQYGFAPENRYQKVCGFDIYPTAYFSPIDYNTGKLHKEIETHSIHWYNASWLSENEKTGMRRMQRINKCLGQKNGEIVFGIYSCIKAEGLGCYLWNRMRKYIKKIIESN